MATRGSGLFSAGSIGMIGGGVLHAIGNSGERPPARLVAEIGMHAYKVSLGGLTWSLHDAHSAMSASYAAFSIWAGVLGLALLGLLRPPARTLAALAWIFAAAPAALALIAGVYRITPPLAVFTLVTALYVAAGVRARA